ncbi:MAG TPA: BatA and WFA domain-containing protein, partial [Chthoniobacteraceae bacterium]|nr:BatA and WFA domain-containing protein [Chthoniobacteraceae bacterium]
MGFLNPLLLWGMAAIAAPIIIHMFMNRRIKQVVWAATRFLQTSIQKNQRRMNLEDIILLLLRCLLLILLALAMSRPIFHKAIAALNTGRSSETAIIVLDNSYSMGESDGGQSRFDLAKAAALQAIDSLPKGSTVAILLFSDVVHAPIPEPTFDLDLARKVVRDAELSDRTTDVQQALKQAFDTLQRHAVATQRIYLITDGQENGWGQFDDILKMLHNETVSTSIILVGSGNVENLGVSNLLLASPMADVGEAAQFDIEVTNFGHEDARDVAVRLNVDSDDPCDEGTLASIPQGSAKRIALFAKFRAPGTHTVTAQINPDRLTADDKRTIALRALDNVHVLIVSGDIGGDPVDNAAFYLANALAPVPLSERENYFIKTKTIAPADLDSVNLNDYEAVVLANVGEISANALDSFPAYLARGGGLVIFPGPRTSAAFYNDNLGAKYNFLPATLGDVRGKPGDIKSVLRLQGTGYKNSIVSLWNDAAAGTLTTANFYCSYILNPVKGHTAQAGEPEVVVKYGDGTAAIMERTWGRGRVILFSSSANTAWNDMPLHPAYL